MINFLFLSSSLLFKFKTPVFDIGLIYIHIFLSYYYLDYYSMRNVPIFRRAFMEDTLWGRHFMGDTPSFLSPGHFFFNKEKTFKFLKRNGKKRREEKRPRISPDFRLF